jgi:DeoR/GlpR family transcriptional regulator of sugar metabolism
MARSAIQGERRRRELVSMLSRSRSVSTAEMARRFDVSSMTIRRDLKALEGSGVAVRSHGGAFAAQRITFEFAFDERRRQHPAEKQRIGAAAAEKVGRGQTLFLDTGTTTLEIAGALARLDVPCTVVTSSLVIASKLWGREQIALMLLGGRVRRGSPDLVGPPAEEMLEKLTADIAFLGSDGIDPSRGSFAADVETARIAERMAANARRAIVVADSSKLGHAAAVRYLRIEDMGELITDRGADRSLVAALRRRGLKVTLA